MKKPYREKTVRQLYLIAFCFQLFIAQSISQNFQKVYASDITEGDYFGYSVAMAGDYAVVSSPFKKIVVGNTTYHMAGQTYVYKRTGTTWIEQQILKPNFPKNGYNFGESVAIDGESIIIGAPGANNFAGAVHIFKKNSNIWEEQKVLTPNNHAEGDKFGDAVSINDGYVIIGAPDKDHYTGTVYIYNLDNEGNWVEKTELQPDDLEEHDNFGISVSIYNNIALVGASGKDNNSGSFYSIKRYVYDNWELTGGVFTASDGSSGDRFGYSISMKKGVAAIGSSNKGFYIFTEIGVNGGFIELIANADIDVGYISVSIDYNLINTAYRFDAIGGSILINDIYGNRLFQEVKPNDIEFADGYGQATAISNGFVLIGAPNRDDNSGTVYFYQYNPTVTTIKDSDDGIDKVLKFTIFQNYPNPFNPSTIISYQVPKLSQVILKVYDVLGSEVAVLVNREQQVGSYEVEFNASKLSSGIYYYQLQAGSFIQTKKMILLR